jgi:signal transduction histidine kinase
VREEAAPDESSSAYSELHIDVLSAGEVLAVAGHELRTPLTSILGFAGTLREHGRALSPDDFERCVAAIERQAARMRDMVDDLLDASLLERGVAEPEFAAVDVTSLLSELIEDLAPRDASHTIRLAADAGTPAARADVSHLRRVVTNLVTNAIRYSARGTTVEVRLRATAGAVVVEVADEGVGIAADDLARVFERYERVAEGARAGAGSGLGLFIARSLVQAMGGRIEVESELGHGSCFRVLLPVARADGRGLALAS